MKENKKIPNFFVVGAARSGTTSLYNYLKQHPEIYLSPIKEPNYFAKDVDTSKFIKPFRKSLKINLDKYTKDSMKKEVHQAWIKDFKQYIKLFKNVKKEKAIGEISTVYLFSKVASKEIFRFNPNAKIIIILREPVERAFSHYKMDFNSKITKESIKELVKKDDNKNAVWGTRSLCLESSEYYKQVKRYLKIFPKKNIKIFFFEDLKKNPEKFVKKVYRFLEVDNSFTLKKFIKYNPTSILSPKSKFLSYISSKLNLVALYNLIPKGMIKKMIDKIYYKDNESLVRLRNSEKTLLKKLYSKDIKKLKTIVNDIPKSY